MTAVSLRYPNAQLENDTDFLEIKVVKYEAPGFNPDSFQQTTSSDSLKNNIETPLAYIFLPIPENIQDSNAVDWGSDSLNGIAARAVGIGAKAIGEDGIGGAIGEVFTGGANLIGGLGAAGVDGTKNSKTFCC